MKSNNYIYGKCMFSSFSLFLLVTMTDRELALFSLLLLVTAKVPHADEKLRNLEIP